MPNHKLLIVLLLTFLILFLSGFGRSQNLITGSTGKNAPLSAIVPAQQMAIRDLIGNRSVSCKWITLNGMSNEVLIDIPGIAMAIDMGGLGSLIADLKVLKVGVISETADKSRALVGMALGHYELNLILDFKPGLTVITGSTSRAVTNSIPFTIELRNRKTGKTREFSGMAGGDSATSVISGTTLRGTLLDSVSQGYIEKGAYVFALSTIEQSLRDQTYALIIGHTKIDNDRGEWKIADLPELERVLIVGFHPNKIQHLRHPAKMEILLKGGNQRATVFRAGEADLWSKRLHRYLGHLTNCDGYTITEYLLWRIGWNFERCLFWNLEPERNQRLLLGFITLPPRQNRVGAAIEFEWMSDYYPDDFRYKLDMPGDWKGGIKYALNKWTEWGNQRKLSLSDFTLDGKYRLTVEARREWNKKNTARIEYEFEIFNVMPEIYEEAVNINWDRVRAEEELSQKFLILSEEYGQARAMWQEVYERERKVHDLTWSSQDLMNVAGELVAMEGSLLILKEGLTKLAMASVKKLLLPKTIYDILKQTGVDLMLIAGNIKTNRAAFSAIRAGWAEAGYKKLWKMTEEGAGDTSFLADLNGPGDDSNPTSSLIGANESSALRTLGQIMEAQKIYALSNGVYARNLEALIQADLLNYSLSSGISAGYRFAVIGQRESFAVTALPLDPIQSGEKGFYGDQSGIIRFEDNGSASEYGQPID